MLHQLLVAVLGALERPGAAAFLQQPQAGDIFQQPDLAAGAEFVGEVQRRATCSLITGSSSSTPISDQVPELM